MRRPRIFSADLSDKLRVGPLYTGHSDNVLSVAVLVAGCVLCLVPFLNKAFHIDDALFIWAARNIQIHPLDFYGFKANWNGTGNFFWDIQKNPPLASYFIALGAYVFGWGEAAVHMIFIVPALAAVLGTFFLAKKMCGSPLEAGLVALSAPAFLLSSTSVMCDTMMLSLWVWAIFFWFQGIKEDRRSGLVFSGVLIAMCSLTKYYGISLIPLLFAYSVFEKRGLKSWIFPLIIPVLVLGIYELSTHAYYGRGLLFEAATYSRGQQTFKSAWLFTRALTGLAFLGGCNLTTVFYLPVVWKRKHLLIGILLTVLTIVVVSLLQLIDAFPLYRAHGAKWPFLLQLSIFSVAGINILFLAASDLRKRRSADSLLLFLWIFGTYIFGAFLNWSVNGRSMLPIVPAAAILIMRHISLKKRPDKLTRKRALLLLLPGLLISLWVTRADYQLANAARTAAGEISYKYSSSSRKLWFMGHWGFQYYMEQYGGKALDFERSDLLPGDILVAPFNNTHVRSITSQGSLGIIDELRFPSSAGVSTMDSSLGAGFYTDLWGPLPFAAGQVRDERYFIFLVTRAMQLR